MLLFAIVGFSLGWVAPPARASQAPSAQDNVAPLPVEAVANAPILFASDLSPDGDWLAYSYRPATDEGRGDSDRTALMEVATSRVIAPDPQGRATRIPMSPLSPWSPDGRYLIHEVIADGSLLVWESRRRRTSTEVRSIATAGKGLSWFDDSRRVVLPVLPAGETRVRGPRQAPINPFMRTFPPTAPGSASVVAYRAKIGAVDGEASLVPERAIGRCGQSNSPAAPCDLAIVDLPDGQVRRIVEGAAIGRFFRPSPGGRHIAYTVYKQRDRDTHLNLYDLHLLDLESGRHSILAADVALADFFGSWSPNGAMLAFPVLRAAGEEGADLSRTASADLMLFAVDGSPPRSLVGNGLPVVAGDVRLSWRVDGARLYVRDIERALWEIDPARGSGRPLASLRGLEVTELALPTETPTVPVDGEILAIVRNADGNDALYRVDLARDDASAVVRGSVRLSAIADASRTGDLVSVGGEPSQRPFQPLLWRPGAESLSAFTDIAALGGVSRLGEGHIVRWEGGGNGTHGGSLLLPPTYVPGQRLPLVVWVYGGVNGSDYVNRFGFDSSAANNMQILATRGYAVFYPDIPQRLGHPMADIATAVEAGVDALIREGIADPERLAIMGHSYGSYSTLAVITQTERFRAAIISAVVHPILAADYVEMRGSGAAKERWAEAGQGLMGGSPWQEPERYRANSPFYLFDRIRTPLLIGQGDLDPGGFAGPGAVFASLRRLGQPVELRVYENEAHGIVRPANIVDWWNRRLSFLAENLDAAVDEQGRVIIDNGRARPRVSLAATAAP